MTGDRGPATRLVPAAFLIVILIAGSAGILLAQTPGSVGTLPAAGLLHLSPQGVADMQSLVDSGHLPDLRWPDFSDYRAHVRDFYEPAGYGLGWVRGSPNAPQATPQAMAVITLLEAADNKGLQGADYDGPRWPERLERLRRTNPPPTENDLARFDLALTVSLMRYISDLHIGKVNPRHFKFGLDIEHKKYKLQDLIRQKIIDSPDPGAVLAQVEPQFAGYRRTVQALEAYLALEKQGDGQAIAVPRTPVHPGDAYPSVPQLAERLALLGDLRASTSPASAAGDSSATYDGPLVDGVKHFQRRHGLDPSGVLDLKTAHEINVPLERRVLQLQMALERWRWIPPDFPRPPIVVNVPEFELRAYSAQQRVALTMRVVVGRAYQHQTPVFAENMRYLIFRPYWNVPLSIQRAEMVPKIRKNRRYLEKENCEMVDRAGRAIGSGPVTDEQLKDLEAGRLEIRQKPGPNNSLGLVKFLFPNEYSVYLHGTPAQELFSKTRRDFSHGCIRLEDPAKLAAWVLADKPAWTAARIRAAMSGGDSTQINLDKPIPVLILYSTAVVQPNGEVDFFDDIYGHDSELEKVLAKGYPYPG
ncbi:MAG TPA: L,D-transpeptidase family protein [Terriglobia bacterium]|nr:L,D-transpeptidase family protein [Terriglobia bacterium]